MKRVLAAAGVLVCVLAPAASGRTRYKVPPGNSGISQYTEVIPSGGGTTPADRVPNSPARNLPAATARALRGPGAERGKLSRFVAGTAPRVSAPHPSTRTPADAGGPSTLGSLLHGAAGSGGGMGLAFPLILLALLLTAVGVVWQRRARS